MQAIAQYLKNRGYEVVEDSYYSYINLWFNWYQGKVASFHNYRQYNGKKRITRTRKTLGMSKKICEDWANLELNEKVRIAIPDEGLSNQIHKVLSDNNFRVRGNQLLELSFALGTGALVEYEDEGEIKIDYIRAGMIYPLRWRNGEIIDCAFASERTQGKRKLIYLNLHEKTPGGYVIKNQMFERNGNNLSIIDLPEGVEQEIQTGTDLPFFQIIKPNIVNNIMPDCPMGISVYANAIDQMEGLDLIYDSYCNEFRLGKKRIIVPTTMARVVMEESGDTAPVFDDNDTEFYSVEIARDAEQKIQEINMELRHEAHEAAIQTALNLLASKCGLGNDRFNFEKGNVKTATEVISEKSELFQNLKKHELILEKALSDMVKAIAFLCASQREFEVTIHFDDSIIEDTNALKQQFLQEIRDQIRQPWEYRMEFFGEDENTAKKMVGKPQTDGSLFEGEQ